jgi:ectoine hydroxylase-related dioxygenase (phytanoyl-CoA dioxygenase family)
METLGDALGTYGFFLTTERLFDDGSIDSLVAGLAKLQESAYARKRDGETYALRNILKAVPEVEDIANNAALLDPIRQVLGKKARPVKAILFDKTKTANWNLRWHQDNVISVEQRLDVPGFTGWSEKVGIPHTRPPVEVLEQMLAARLHIDDCPAENGALAVIPMSHAQGRLTLEQVQEHAARKQVVVCACDKGQVLFMRPLLLHSSGRSEQPKQRRVLHIEYAGIDLPGGLEWGV